MQRTLVALVRPQQVLVSKPLNVLSNSLATWHVGSPWRVATLLALSTVASRSQSDITVGDPRRVKLSMLQRGGRPLPQILVVPRGISIVQLLA